MTPLQPRSCNASARDTSAAGSSSDYHALRQSSHKIVGLCSKVTAGTAGPALFGSREYAAIAQDAIRLCLWLLKAMWSRSGQLADAHLGAFVNDVVDLGEGRHALHQKDCIPQKQALRVRARV